MQFINVFYSNTVFILFKLFICDVQGIVTNWFKREIGKNTGKYVSNKIFGDKWATPHKVIIARENAKIDKQGSQDFITSEFKKLEIETKRNEIQ